MAILDLRNRFFKRNGFATASFCRVIGPEGLKFFQLLEEFVVLLDVEKHPDMITFVCFLQRPSQAGHRMFSIVKR